MVECPNPKSSETSIISAVNLDTEIKAEIERSGNIL
jgi:hypothetical protein